MEDSGLGDRAADALGPLESVLRYHRETKHHFQRYARALRSLDWANQPSPFRRYESAPLFALPMLKSGATPSLSQGRVLYEDLYRPGAIASQPVSIQSLSCFLECSLAITAWKQAGDTRWALRANPSSGNLHPTEGYLLIGALPGLAPVAGLYHYAAMQHALELRAEWGKERFEALLCEFPRNAFLLGFSSVNWRETWKYGERAFRYCQHDVGHALAGARIAAQTLGWRMLLLDGTADDTVARLLGLDRSQDRTALGQDDFEPSGAGQTLAEPEHPDCLAVVWPADQEGILPGDTISLPLFLAPDVVQQATPPIWHGKANRLSRDVPVPWSIIDQVERASWKLGTECKDVAIHHGDVSKFGASALARAHAPIYPDHPSADKLIRQRRSATAFDGKTSMTADSFFTMLARVMPHADLDLCRRPMPWDALPLQPAVHLALFVHRVDGLAPGIYLLVRDRAKVEHLKTAMQRPFAWAAPPGCPLNLPLFLLEEGDAQQLSITVSCHQAIAGDGVFSLGMIAEFEPSLRRYGPWFYRRLFWETGVIGQLLYLEAEAIGIRATGIGCFFDDPVHQVLGLSDARFQSLYHFTMGGSVEDIRLTTLPAYA